MVNLFHRFAFVTVLFLPVNLVFAQTQVVSNPIVMQPVSMGISKPMRDLPVSSENEKSIWKDGIIPLRTPPNFRDNKIEVEKAGSLKDGSLKDYQGSFGISDITQNFEGVAASGFAPPDPSGDVGPNHYVQMVNVRTQIWDKIGNSLVGPVNNSTFWTALGPPYNTSNDGDPIVLYDDMADRWLVSQFCLPNFPNGPFYELIAISTTTDPTGTYFQYAYSFANMPDYPKFGVWPDGYYMSANVFASGTLNYVGTYVAVFDRNTMLTGGAATMQYFTPGISTWSFLPSDCDGAAPPSGAPNYFLATNDNTLSEGKTDLDIYEFHVDWSTPANTTFSPPLLLTTPAFNYLTTGTDIPQLGTTNKLDNLDYRPMNRLQYRNFGDHQAMVVCQTVDAGSNRAGMRWWELRKTSGDWSIYQEGTHAPADGLYRWMGSIAMDANGTIALGYSTSGSTIRPDIRYTGRMSSDPLGLMTFEETVIYAGAGVQNGTLHRWGDYTQMTVDPSVSGTFWYTNQYIPTNGTFNWRTRIAAFHFVPAPIINYVSSVVTGGNGDGKIDFNECNDLSITLNNIGQLNATNISATLSTATPGVSITQSVSAYSDINVGLSGSNITAYKVSTSPGFVCGTTISFSLNVTYTSGSKIINFSLPSGTTNSPQEFINNTVTAIPDNNLTGVDVPIIVSGITSSIAKVTVSIYITHTWDSDLLIQLIAPDNTTITLASGVGSNGDNFGSNCSPQTNRTTFDDAALTSISSGTAPFVGTYKPSGLLSTFIGKTGAAVNGTWKLHVRDDTPIDIGSVQCFSLFISPISCTDGGGECPLPKTLGITVIPEGFYNGTTMISDAVTIQLRNSSAPYSLVEETQIALNTSGTGTAYFFSAADATLYYIVVKHRNSIETWSADPQSFSGGTLSYDFTTAQTQAFGSNMKLKGTKWCIYGGEIAGGNQFIDADDVTAAFNAQGLSGYIIQDVTGNNFVDADDVTLAFNNQGIGRVIPSIILKSIPRNTIKLEQKRNESNTNLK